MVNTYGGIYANRRVLVTGHTGFKGGWLSLWLHQLGARVSGYALPCQPGESFFSILDHKNFIHSWLQDIRDLTSLETAITACQPEIIFHLAAQPLVGLSYREPIDTFTTNALGTALLLEAVRKTGCPAQIIIVTSDKCYRNDNTGRPFVEEDALGGADVYSMSKAAAELVVASWHASFFAKNKALGSLATARAGNVIGGGDYAEDRIVPDAVRAFQNKSTLKLRCPQATRPWQHVLESLSGYLCLGQRLLSQPKQETLLNINFGPDFEAERSVRELMDTWLEVWPDALNLEVSQDQSYSEAARLSLNHHRAFLLLEWKPVWNFKKTIDQTAQWYRQRHQASASDTEMLDYTLRQLNDYTHDARQAGLTWTH